MSYPCCGNCGFEMPRMHDDGICVFCSNLPDYKRSTYSESEKLMLRSISLCMNELLHQIELTIANREMKLGPDTLVQEP